MSKAILHMNIDSELKKELQRQATEANRSLSNHVETLLLLTTKVQADKR